MNREQLTDDQLFFRLLHNRTDKTYWNNIVALRARPGDTIFTRCHELATTGNEQEKILAVNVLAQLGGTPRPFYAQSIALYFDMLETTRTPKLISTILYAVGHNNKQLSAAQICHIATFSRHPRKDVRSAVVYALLTVNDPVAIDTLILLSTDKVADIRNWATFGLGTQLENRDAHIINALWNRINDTNEDTRLEAIAGLAHREDPRVKDMPELAQLSDFMNP